MKTSELTGAALDWAVAKCEGYKIKYDPMGFGDTANGGCWVWSDPNTYWKIGRTYSPSTIWSQGGPIIEREALTVCTQMTRFDWQALDFHGDTTCFGPTPLIAAMRCYVASKLGEEIEVSEELK